MVEEMGTVPAFDGLGNTYVFAQTWPSWSFAVDGLGLKNISTCVEWNSVTAREEFKATALGSTLVSMSTVRSRLDMERDGNLKPPLLFIQGSPSFVTRILDLCSSLPCHSICAMVGLVSGHVSPAMVQDIRGLHWRQLSHRSLAGITTGTWMFGSSLDLGRYGGIPRSALRRTFGDIASHTIHGTLFDSLPPPRTHHLARKIYFMEDRVPFGEHGFPVATPSVYAPNQALVVRNVSLCEMMCIYDIECAAQRALFSFWEDYDANPTFAFCKQAPVKVLYAGARHLLSVLAHSPPQSSDGSNDGISVPDITLQSDLGESADHLDAPVGAPADASVGTPVGDGVGSHVGHAARASDDGFVRESVGPPFGDGDGRDDGSPVGDGDGARVGSPVGDGDGIRVGSPVGDGDGGRDGSPVGAGDGIRAGSPVGDGDGVGVGSPGDGSPVGDGVGVRDGSPVGVGDGAGVGSPVGDGDGVVHGSPVGDGHGVGHGSPVGDGDGAFGMEKDTSSSTATDVKAAKNDDAKVNVDDWNFWTIHSYVPTSSSERPLICKPGPLTDPMRHAFDVIRRGMLYAWKRRLLRGFRKYLNHTHDGGRLVPFSTHYCVLNENYMKEGGKKWTPIPVTVNVSPWCLSPFARKLPRKRRRSSGVDEELLRDILQGVDCLERAGHSTFWEWKDGSSIFFWRWPARYKKALRDGSKLWICGKLPHWKRPQRVPPDPDTRAKLLAKLQVPRSKRYIAPGFVRSRTGYFDVPKGKDDIRIVYDATACGLNRALWSPNFYLPTIDALLRNADSNTFYGDIDLGEMFLNYALDETLCPYAGVDVSALDPARIRGEMTLVIERWERTLMGLRPSPFVCTQAFSWSEEIIKGDRLAKDNPLRWDKVVLNLPGDPSYDPSRPWVYKWNSVSGSLAGSFGTYVDDIRTQNDSEASCRATTHRVASGVGYLGQQDAPRKRRPPSKRPGAWSGAMCFSTQDEGLYVTCSQEKWDKGKRLVKDLYEEVVTNGATSLDRSSMEKSVGFLVHLSRTFPALFPYFKGIYLTMESWREGRDDEGWKFSRKAWWNLMAGAMEDEDENDNLDKLTFEERKKVFLDKNQSPRPKCVSVVKRLARDLTALMKLFDHASPPKRLVRGNKLREAVYGFGDASGSGFGSSWDEKGSTRYRVGMWGSDMDASSSNHRELRNLVDSLKVMEKEGTLGGTEAFIFTDNSTAEAAFFKGTSSSPALFDLVLELRQLEMRAECRVHLIHVAGTRMIAQGSDGLSRGNFTEGSMKGDSMLNFIPISKSALERSPDLEGWLRSWAGDDLEFLKPEGWFERGHDLTPEGDRNVEGHWIPAFKPGCFVWSPPPAAAEVAIEELRKARHKHQESHHIFVVPRLMKPYWYKHLCKTADLILTLPVGHPVWPKSMHEPLTIGLCFPYLKNRPWELKRQPKLLELGRISCMGCGKVTAFPRDLFCGNFGAFRGGSHVCRRSWHPKCYVACQKTQFQIALPENNEGVKWRKKKDEDRFLVGRGGDSLGTPFQCDWCWFYNLEKRDPISDSYSDNRLLGYIRRVNLDMMWSREPSTVSSILGNVRKGKRMSEELNLDPIELPMGPWPVGDFQGFQVAIEMLRASLLPGKNDEVGQQYDTIRKLRSAYSNVFESGPAGVRNMMSFKGAYGHMVHFSSSVLNSVLFRLFIHGMEKRMGRLVLQNIALSPEMLISVLDNIEEELMDVDATWERKRHLIMCGGAFVTLFAGALRGEEILMAEASELCQRIRDGKYNQSCSHVCVPLMGRFKHETGERNILLALASVTEGSGIEVRKWIERWVALLIRENKHSLMGPALCDVNGYSYPRGSLNHELHRQLAKLQQQRPDFIDPGVEIAERFSIHRSFRRGATTKALANEVPHHIVVMNNRWRKAQQKSGSLPNLPMSVLYTEIQQSLLTRLQFSRSL